MKEKIKAIIVDDLESMRVVLKKLLANFEQIEIIAEAADYDEAKLIIQEDKPDLLFLDIDPAEVERARRDFPVERDRKDSLYPSLLY